MKSILDSIESFSTSMGQLEAQINLLPEKDGKVYKSFMNESKEYIKNNDMAGMLSSFNNFTKFVETLKDDNDTGDK